MFWIASTILATGCLAAAYSDTRHRKITNRLNLAILVLGLGWRAASFDLSTLALGFAGVGVGLAVLFAPFAVRWVGAGDVKFLAACGAWLGPFDTLLCGLFGLLGGGILAVLVTARAGAEVRRSVAQTFTASVATFTAPAAPKRAQALVVPLGVPLGAAAIALFVVGGF
jgi:prepilin peptidase CpaA